MSHRLIVNIATYFLCCLTPLTLMAQPLCHVIQYDEENGVPSSHVTQLLQDEQGFMWFATWNGLARFDGYEFQTFKPLVGDGCNMPTDRIRNIMVRSDGNILCQCDDDYYLFDLKVYRFRNLTQTEKQEVTDGTIKLKKSKSVNRNGCITWEDDTQTTWKFYSDGRTACLKDSQEVTADYIRPVTFENVSFACSDHQGNLWVLDHKHISLINTHVPHIQRLDITPAAEVRCLFQDQQKRIWVTTKDGVIRIYNQDLTFLGFLGSDGQLHPNYTRFGAPVYCILQTSDGTLWLGTKPNGLYRLRETVSKTFSIEHIQELPGNDVYSLLEDAYGRLWAATLDQGLYYSAKPQIEHPRFEHPKNYPKQKGEHLRFLHITQHNFLLAATTEGLLISQLKNDVRQMAFRFHQREADRVQSLSSSAIMDVTEDSYGNIYISTESGGVNKIEGRQDLSKEKLDFTHYNQKNHLLPSDIAISTSMTADNKIIVVSSHQISIADEHGQMRVFDSQHYETPFHYSEAHVLSLDDGQLLFGLTDGAYVTTMEQIDRPDYEPHLVLTGASIQGGEELWSVTNADTLLLQPHERNVTVKFAALNFGTPERINYAFRLLPDQQWNNIGHTRSVTLLDLEPDSYELEIRCTNANGTWVNQTRRLTIIVKPTFRESTWGQLLILLFVAVIIGTTIYTIYYIRKIKKKQHDTMEAYLALLENKENKLKKEEPMVKAPNATSDPVIRHVIKYIEKNLGNSDANVGDMANAAATSRSSLQRKLKHEMGITPQDLLREARIKHACKLLRETEKSIAEVAYACGFIDPKYFSRIFKHSTGLSPTDYKNTSAQ